MALEATPPGKASDGQGLVLFVPTIANPAAPTAAELNAGTVKPLTYSLVPDGFRHETTENVITTGRYTLKQVLELAGTVTDTIEVQYVYTGTVSDVARIALATGVSGFIVHRLGVANETAPAAAQIVDVIPITAGIQRKVPPTANTELQRVQKLFVTGPVQRDVAVAA